MIITESRLRTFIRMQLLQEAFIDRLLQNVDNPRHREDLLYASNAGLSNSTLQWLLKVFKENTEPDGDHYYEPIDDMIPTLKSFEKNKSAIAARARARELYDPDNDPDSFYSADINKFEYIHDLRDMLNHLEQKQRGKREKEDIKRAQTSYIYKGPQFNVVMPKTVESSCFWGMDTKWCTAATKSQNLFLSYVARGDENIVLYYILKKGANPRKDPYAKMSVGFVNGEPILDGQRGGVSVDSTNEGMDGKRLQLALGLEYGPIMLAMKKHAGVIKGKHPAKKQMEAAAKDFELFKKYTRGMGHEEFNDFLEIMIQNHGQHMDYNMQDTMYDYIKSLWKRGEVNPNMLLNLQDVSQNIVRRVLSGKAKGFIRSVAIRKAKDEIISEFIASGEIDLEGPPTSNDEVTLRQALVRNKATPWPVVRKMIGNGLKRYYQENQSLNIRSMREPRDNNWNVLNTALVREDMPPDLVANILETYKDDSMIFKIAIKHPSLPKDVFNKAAKEILAGDTSGKHVGSFLSLLESPNLSNNIITQILEGSDKSIALPWILESVLKNPNVSVQNIERVWEIWENINRQSRTKHPQNTSNILMTMMYHNRTPDSILQKIIDARTSQKHDSKWFGWDVAQEILDGRRQRHPPGHIYQAW